ncbi:MAG TPA: oligopeptidase A, partial [Gammaproteobacteria bacterium]|nr:oligopeptidase A [Gammaproteobacteria bacterium]
MDTVLADNRAALQQLGALATPGWQNFIEPQEALADRLHRVWAPVGHLNAVLSGTQLRAAYNACLARLAEYDTELGQNEALQRGYLALKSGRDWKDYSLAQRKLVEDALRDFRLAGVDLPPEKKQRFRAVMQELTQLEAKFEDNVLDATQGRTLQVTDAARTAGIPAAALSRARSEAAERKLEGWVFTLDYPAYSAVVIHADDRALR